MTEVVIFVLGAQVRREEVKTSPQDERGTRGVDRDTGCDGRRSLIV